MDKNLIQLRELRRGDSQVLYGWINDRDLVVHNAPYRPVGIVAHEDWFDSMLMSHLDVVMFGIETVDSSELIGTCQLLKIHPVHRNAELQIRIGNEAHRGKGFGSQAIRLLTAFGFNDLNLHRIYLHVFDSNALALKAYRKCGFVEEGTLRDGAFIDGKWVDIVMMAKLRGE